MTHMIGACGRQDKYKDSDYVNDYTKGPTDEEFREFYEGVYNPQNV